MGETELRGKIEIDFRPNAEPVVTFSGQIDSTDIQSMIYYVRQGFHADYMQRRRAEEVANLEETKKKIEAQRKKAEQEELERIAREKKLAEEQKAAEQKIMGKQEEERHAKELEENKKLEAARREARPDMVKKAEEGLAAGVKVEVPVEEEPPVEKKEEPETKVENQEIEID